MSVNKYMSDDHKVDINLFVFNEKQKIIAMFDSLTKGHNMDIEYKKEIISFITMVNNPYLLVKSEIYLYLGNLRSDIKKLVSQTYSNSQARKLAEDMTDVFLIKPVINDLTTRGELFDKIKKKQTKYQQEELVKIVKGISFEFKDWILRIHEELRAILRSIELIHLTQSYHSRQKAITELYYTVDNMLYDKYSN